MRLSEIVWRAARPGEPYLFHSENVLWRGIPSLKHNLLSNALIAHLIHLFTAQPLFWLLLMALGSFYLFISFRMTMRKSTVHGSARFASRWEAGRYHQGSLVWLWQSLQRRRRPPESRLSLGCYHGLTISLSEKQQESNVLLTAPVGSGKSSLVIIPNLLREYGSRSLFIADLKGELYALTAGALACHHQIWYFVPTHPDTSQGYNPLSHINTVEEAQDFADCWVSNTGESQEPYWANTARLLISAVVMHLRAVERTAPFSRLAEIIKTKTFAEIKTLLTTSPSQAARREAQSFLDYMSRNERLVGSIMTDIGNRFQLLASTDICQATARDDLDFCQMVENPTAFYLSIPRNASKRLRPLLACLTMQMFTCWERYAEQQPARALPRGVACYLDEFTNIGHIPGFADFISSARSKRIALLMAIQSFSQLDACYGEEDAETIKNNAVTHLLLPGAGLQETRYYSERVGDTTVQTATRTSAALGTGSQQALMQGEARRRLLAPEELRTLPENTLLMVSKASPSLLIRGKPYFRDRRLARLAHLSSRTKGEQQSIRGPVVSSTESDSQAKTATVHVPDHSGNDYFFLKND